jgi:UPF0716 family protein affecting phage T7 exclusion
MWVLAIFYLLALVAVVAKALGDGWGLTLLGFGFAAWAALIRLSGLRGPFSSPESTKRRRTER